MAQVIFHERQSVPSLWRIAIFGFVTLLMGFAALMTYLTEWDTMPDSEKPFLLVLLAGPLGVLFIFFIRLDIRMTQQSFDFKLAPFRRNYRSIAYTDMVEIHLSELTGFTRLRTLGVNRRLYRQEYYFGGRHILSILLRNGRQLSFSTHKPRELQHFLSYLPDEVPVKGREMAH